MVSTPFFRKRDVLVPKKTGDDHKCCGQQICPSGVYVCPYWRGKEPYRIGDAKTQSLDEIWHSDRRKSIMDQLDPVIKCDFHCLRNETNREVIRIQGMDKGDVEIVPEYDRFF